MTLPPLDPIQWEIAQTIDNTTIIGVSVPDYENIAKFLDSLASNRRYTYLWVDNVVTKCGPSAETD